MSLVVVNITHFHVGTSLVYVRAYICVSDTCCECVKMEWDRKQCLFAKVVTFTPLSVTDNMFLYSLYRTGARGIRILVVHLYVIYKLNVHTTMYLHTYCIYVSVYTYDLHTA